MTFVFGVAQQDQSKNECGQIDQTKYLSASKLWFWKLQILGVHRSIKNHILLSKYAYLIQLGIRKMITIYIFDESGADLSVFIRMMILQRAPVL